MSANPVFHLPPGATPSMKPGLMCSGPTADTPVIKAWISSSVGGLPCCIFLKKEALCLMIDRAWALRCLQPARPAINSKTVAISPLTSFVSLTAS